MRWRDYDRAKEFRDPEGYSLIWSTLARRSVGSPDATNDLDTGAVNGRPKVVGELFVGRITAATATAASENGHQACEAHFYSGQHGWQSLGIGQEGAFNRTLVMPEIVS
jgi:hypothetical protein